MGNESDHKKNSKSDYREQFPMFCKYTTPIKQPVRTVIGREKELQKILAAFERPELCNVLLLADAGAGKTSLVQQCSVEDKERFYVEVDVAKMLGSITVDSAQLGQMLKQLFDEAEQFKKVFNQDIVLFFDEFHQIIQFSVGATESLKPVLAASGHRGIRIIAATTYVEFRQYVSSNQPLVERLQRINIAQTDKFATIQILKGMAEKYGVLNVIEDNLYEYIYDYTNRYVPANSQPRKSILVFDSMIGYHRRFDKDLDFNLLAEVLKESEGVNVAFRADTANIKKQLDSKVFAQEFATRMISDQLSIVMADLNNKDRPISFLFSGATGTGKGNKSSEKIPIANDKNVRFKTMGELVVGDYVFNAKGEPVMVTGVYPRGKMRIYEVELTDGRVLECSEDHLWTYRSRTGNGAKYWKTTDVETLRLKYENKHINKGRNAHTIKYVIPMNEAVAWLEGDFRVDPYLLGLSIGNGCLTQNYFEFSTDDLYLVHKIKNILGAVDFKRNSDLNYGYTFAKSINKNGSRCRYRNEDIFVDCVELIGKKASDKFIPEIYKTGSICQRWALIRGLFDTDGSISNDDRFRLTYSSSSKQLVIDIQDVLYSLGVSSIISQYKRKNATIEYTLRVKCDSGLKQLFFTLPRKLKRAKKAAVCDKQKKRIKKFNEVIGIRDIRKTDRYDDIVCIMVDDEDHLYQVGDFVVTHNTQVTKEMAKLLFDDYNAFIRFDMAEYSRNDSEERFRTELTNKVWARPNSVVLFDEIEKANGAITRMLLSVLDDGRLTDQNNREISFNNTYIVMTTNAGSEVYKNISQYAASDTGDGQMRKDYNKLIRRSLMASTGAAHTAQMFPPELLNRINVIIPFQPLSLNTQKRIAATHLDKLKQKLKKLHDISVEFDDRLIIYITEENLDTETDSGGARGVIFKIDFEVITPIAKFINEHPHIKRIKVKVNGVMSVEDKTDKQGNAYITVSSN